MNLRLNGRWQRRRAAVKLAETAHDAQFERQLAAHRIRREVRLMRMSRSRILQAILIVSAFGLSWLAMMAVHELGHVLHAVASGGTVVGVVLNPLEISRTDVSPNPHPQ
jgi:hypothetical protein